MKQVTMQDIADRLGVSKVTVSKYFNQSGDISQEMMDKIKDVALELGYVYNPGKRKNVSVLVTDIFLEKDEGFYTRFFKKLVTEANDHHIDLILSVVSNDMIQKHNIPDAVLETVGVFLLGQFEKSYITTLKKQVDNIVLIDFEFRNLALFSVVTNNFQASYNVTSMLIDLGHKDIGFVGNIKTTTSIQDRYLGYYKALLENNLILDDSYHIEDRDTNGNWIAFDLPKKMPTALVCNNDHVAYLLVQKLKKNGYHVPRDVSVVGFDDIRYSEISEPKLTTVRVKMDVMSMSALKMMKSLLLKKKNTPYTKIVDTDIIHRDSVSKPKK